MQVLEEDLGARGASGRQPRGAAAEHGERQGALPGATAAGVLLRVRHRRAAVRPVRQDLHRQAAVRLLQGAPWSQVSLTFIEKL